MDEVRGQEDQRYRRIVEDAPVAIVQVDEAGRLVLANSAAASILGYESPAELMARPPAELAAHLFDGDAERIVAAVAAGPPYPSLELRVKHRDGADVWVEIQAKPIAGTKATVEAFVRDLTAVRAADQARIAETAHAREVARLLDLTRMRAQFMDRASHELNTPLTPILLQVQALQVPGQDPRQARGLAILERNVVRMAALVKDLLTASALAAGGVQGRPERFDLAAKASEVVDVLRPQAEQLGVTLRLAPSAQVPAFADADLSLQVLFNLVGNAIKYTPRAGSVTVCCVAQSDGLALCTITDTGRGFAPADKNKLFAPFKRLHDDLRDSPPGTGLGLFIAKSLVEQSGGSIWGHSEGPGQGSTFGFTLPSQGGPDLGRGIASATGFGPRDQAVAEPKEGPRRIQTTPGSQST